MNTNPTPSGKKPYIEPDHFAHRHDGAIPVISSIGRGPKGDSITAEREGADLVIENDNGEELARFTIGDIDVSIVPQTVGEITGGQPSYFDVVVDNGSTTKTTRVIVPCGERGTQIWVSKHPEQLRDDESFTVHEYEANPAWGGESVTGKARIGDVVMCGVYEADAEPIATKVAFGYVVGFTSEQYLICATQTLLDMSSSVVDYSFTQNKPEINGTVLNGSLDLSDLGILTGKESDRFGIEVNQIVGGALVGEITPEWRGTGSSHCFELGNGLYLVTFYYAAHNLWSGYAKDQAKLNQVLSGFSGCYGAPLLRIINPTAYPNYWEDPHCSVIYIDGQLLLLEEDSSLTGWHNPGALVPGTLIATRNTSGYSWARATGDETPFICFSNGGQDFYDAHYDTATDNWKLPDGGTAGFIVQVMAIVQETVY